MVKDLFLHLLIVLLPILIGHYMSSVRLADSAWTKGVVTGLAIMSCISMPINFNGFLWDLRSIPLVICYLYAGPRAGLVATIMMVSYRLYVGGPMLHLIFTSAVLQSLLPFLLHKRFVRSNVKQRVRTVFLLSLVSFFILFSHMYIYMSAEGDSLLNHLSPLQFVLFGCVHVLAMVVSSLLIENIIEMCHLRSERVRTEKLAVLSELAASVAHEIRNPLTVVRGFLQLTRETLDDKNKSFISTAIVELDRAEKIISDYLSFAKPQLEHVSVIQMNELISNTTDLIHAYAAMRGVELSFQPEQELQVSTDKFKLQQVLMNLMKNAVEAIDENKADGKVEIRTAAERGFVRVQVSDNGKGMTEDQIKRLGDPYYSTKETGTGLGLMVTFRLVDAMQGKLQFHSAPASGTQANLYIPLLAEAQSL